MKQQEMRNRPVCVMNISCEEAASHENRQKKNKYTYIYIYRTLYRVCVSLFSFNLVCCFQFSFIFSFSPFQWLSDSLNVHHINQPISSPLTGESVDAQHIQTSSFVTECDKYECGQEVIGSKQTSVFHLCCLRCNTEPKQEILFFSARVTS